METKIRRIELLMNIDEVMNETNLDESFYRGSGPGGQHKNKTETGCRLINRLTGDKVEICVSRSQPQNRKLARQILRSKIISRYSKDATRNTSDAIVRTYREVDDRVVDHASGLEGSYKEIVLVGRGIADMINAAMLGSKDLKRTGR